MARDDLDELFGEGNDTPEPRVGPAIGMAIGGVLVALVGMACLAAPGGVIVLGGLWWIERELDRVENGYLPSEARPAVERGRRIVLACLVIVILLFFVQAWLYCGGFYQNLGDALVGLTAGLQPSM